MSPIREEVYAYDSFNDSNGTPLESHSPDIGSSWVKNGTFTSFQIQNNAVDIPSGIGSSNLQHQYRMSFPSLPATNYIEKEIVFSCDTNSLVFHFGQTDSGWLVRWNIASGQVSLIAPPVIGGGVSNFDIGPGLSGVHRIFVVGQEDTLTVYCDGKGVRITDIPSSGQIYSNIAFGKRSGGAGVNILSVYGALAAEPDFIFLFNMGFPPNSDFAGGAGGGGGSGGSPSSGGSNPLDIPCDPGEVLVINNGAAVSVAPTDPCLWTGLIWYKFVCEEVLTESDYAVEADVFFNTLTDSFMSIGVFARLNEASGGHYFATLWNSEIVVGKKLSTGTDDIILATVPVSLTAGKWYTVRLELEGNLLRAYLNNELKITTTDPNSSFADPGCAGGRFSRGNPSTDLRMDNFAVWLSVRRPLILESPLLNDLLSIKKDDGMGVIDVSIDDAFKAFSFEELLVPKIVHLNDGTIFLDTASQVKIIQELCLVQDFQVAVGVSITFTEIVKALEHFNFNMNVPVPEVLSFLDSEETIHGVSETLTLGDVLSLNVMAHRLETSRMGDTVSILKTEEVGAGPDPDAVFQVRLRIYRTL